MSDPPLTIKGWLRYDVVNRVLDTLDGVESVLEVGAGEGALGVRLARRYRYVGVEPDPQSFATARARFERAGLESVVQGDVDALSTGAAFDLVCAFEVLEHCENDEAELRRWAARIRPGGRLLLSVPAGAHRFGPADRKAGHVRRYERDELARKLAAAGLEPQTLELYGFPLGNLLEAAWNALARLRAGTGSPGERTAASGRHLQPRARFGRLTRAAAAPGRLAQRGFRDRGTGLVALARRP